MTPFPLLQLPFVPLTNILKCWNPIELFTLSQCSKRMIETIKLADTRKFLLSVDFSYEEITINKDFRFGFYEKTSDQFKKANTLGYCSFGSNDRPFKVPVASDLNCNDNLDTFWDDCIVGVEIVCFHLFEIFGCEIDEFRSGYILPFKKFQSIVEEILENQSEIRNLMIGSEDCTDEHLKWALDTVKVTEALDIYVKASENFTYNRKILSKYVKINYSSWFTVDNLLCFDSCVVMRLNFTTWTNKDLEQFINLWKAGNYPNLEYLTLWSRSLDESKLMAGTYLRNFQNVTRVKRIDNEDYKITGGVDIQRDDGIMGTIELQWCTLKFLVLN